MVFEFKLPDIGEGVHEGEIVSWLVAEGDRVEEDQDIVEVMTDKATVQLSSPRAGTIQEIRFQEGDVLNVGDVFVVIAEADDATTDGATSDDEATRDATADDEATRTRPAATSNGGDRPKRTPHGVLAPPSVRNEARRRGIDLSQLTGAGPAGRIGMAELDEAGHRSTEGHADGQVPPASSGDPRGRTPARGGHAFVGSDFDVPQVSREDASGSEAVRAVRGTVKGAASRAKRMQPHYTHVIPLDATKLDRAATEAAVDPAALVVKAVALALRKHPRCGGRVDETTGDLVVPGERNVAVAVPSDDGLTIRVVGDADHQAVGHIARVLSSEEEGPAPDRASILVVALGAKGGYTSTPVLLHPQVSALALGVIVDEAVVHDGQVGVAKRVNLSWSFDHRYVDGYDGALFGEEVAKLLREPGTLLLDDAS